MKSKTIGKLNFSKFKIATLSKVYGGASPNQQDTHTGVTTTIPTRTQPSRTLNN